MKWHLIAGLLLACSACRNPATASPIEPTPSRTLPPSPAATADAPSATPEFTPTSVPLYFTEDFSRGLEPWSVFQTGGETAPDPGVRNGLLRFDIPSPDSWYYLIHNAHEYRDVFLTARFSGTPSGSMGLVCRYGRDGWFEFNLASDGTYSVLFGHWLAEGIAQYSPITGEESEYLQAGNLRYEIGLTCQQDFLLLHVNGKLFRKVNVARFGLAEGRIGLSVASFEETPMIAAFDWLTVAEPAQ